MQMLPCKLLLKNTTHTSLHVAFHCRSFCSLIETLSEQRRNLKLCRTCFMTVPTSSSADELFFFISWEHCDEQLICAVYCAVNMYKLTWWKQEQFLKEQLRLKLCKNLRTTSLGQNLLVLIKMCNCISSFLVLLCCCKFLYFLDNIISKILKRIVIVNYNHFEIAGDSCILIGCRQQWLQD